MLHALLPLFLVLTGLQCAAAQPPAARPPAARQPAAAPADTATVRSLFDGVSLGGWKDSEFGFPNRVKVEDGAIILGMSDYLTGITWTRDFPKVNYEIALQAMRVEGGDFFCGLTFPVQDDFCTLIVGGWAGVVVGLSNIDGLDASENDYGILKRFDNKRWYDIRLRVTDEKIQAWIDDEQVIDFEIGDHELSVRADVNPSKPLGIASWRTTAALRHITVRELPAD